MQLHNDKYPRNLKTADEVASKMPGISATRLLEYARAGYCPHFRVLDQLLFKFEETRDWIQQNAVTEHGGRPLPEILRVCVPAAEVLDLPPIAISSLPLQQIALGGINPGVYFLCQGAEIVYIGQSKFVQARIDTHLADPEKQFDRAYLMPVPESELDNVEGALIRCIKPKLNKRKKTAGDTRPIAPNGTRGDAQTLSLIGFDVRDIDPSEVRCLDYVCAWEGSRLHAAQREQDEAQP